jgi:polyphosphate kinase
MTDDDDPAATRDETESATDPSAVGPESVDPDLTAPKWYLNRELSELAFQRRVLHEAVDERNPLLERVRFLSILTTNLDEFFMKRVGGLKQQIAAGVTDPTPDGRTPAEQHADVLAESGALIERQARCWREHLRPALADVGIGVVDYSALSTAEQSDLDRYFEESVLPTLTPLTFDPAHPFPHISNLSLSLAVLTRGSPDDDPTFSRVKVPGNRPRLVRVGDSDRYVLLESLIEHNLDALFPDVEIVDASAFRVTRNAEVRRNEEVAEDLIEVTEEVLRERRFATVVRLAVEADMPAEARSVLVEQLDLDPAEVFEIEGPLGFEEFGALTDLDRPELRYDPWTPRPHPRLLDDDANVFDEIRAGDVLVHHPYHSFDETVHRFLDAAARDPDVLAIKAAIYRTANDSKVIESLLEAARNGKQVAVMIELKARFDEAANLGWVETLEEEGIHVAYGTLGYKTHTKTSLVVRDESDPEAELTSAGASDDVTLYSHVGTGNYHSQTAKSYEDLGLLTADPDVGQDLVKLFNFFTGHSRPEGYRELLVAPDGMRTSFADLIRREARHAAAGREGRIVAKMNRLEDPELVRELYAASMAGVEIDLIVRDICRLRPGLQPVSENVTVHSIVGRFLEHARVFEFGNAGDPEFYLGSADWMQRNLDNRVEVVAPIRDPELCAELRWILRATLADNRRRWVLDADGTYEQRRPGDDPVRDLQRRLMDRTREAVQAANRRDDRSG